MDYDIGGQIYLLPIDHIIPNINQPRKDFNIDELSSLAKSIKKNGVLQPINVRRNNKGFEIISGERRFRACIMAGFDTIPAIITDCSDERSALFCLTENIQRKNLNFFEEAAAIYEITEKYGYSRDEIVVLSGKTLIEAEERLSFMKLPPRIREKMELSRISSEYIRILGELEDINELDCLLNTIIAGKLTIDDTKKFVNSLNEVKGSCEKRKTVMIFKDIRLFINTLDHTVETMNNSGIMAQREQRETENYIEYTVRIPKSNTSVLKSC